MKWLPIGAFILAAAIRIIYFGHPDGFYSDSAIRFRFARMYSQGEKIPEVDKKLLYPEGLRVTDLIHLTMDWFVGITHRITRPIFGIDLITHIRYLVSIISSISILAFYYLSRLYLRDRKIITLIVLLYAVGIAGFWRIAGNYLREEFALPSYLFAIYLFLASRRWYHPLLSGLCFGLTLILWHLSRFSYLVFLGYIIFAYLIEKNHRDRLIINFTLMIIPISLAALLSPTLRAKLFIISLPLTLSYLLIISHHVSRWLKLNPLYTLPFLILAPLPILAAGQMGEYSHVFQLLLSKIRFLGAKPDDPNLVPYQARLIWFGPFSSPGIFSILIAFGLTPLLGLIGACLEVRKSGLRSLPILFFFFAFLLGYLLIIRLEIFLYPFLLLMIGILLTNTKKSFLQYLFLVIIIPEFIKPVFYSQIYQRYLPRLASEWESRIGAIGDEFDRIIEWFKRNTHKDEAVLGYIDVSAMILSRSGNPIVLEPIYELSKARERVRRYLGLLYENEGKFVSILRKRDIDYVLYDRGFLLDDSKSSLRYIFAIDRIERKSAAFMMHFYPESIPGLSLRYQTLSYRIFKVDTSQIQVDLNYSPYFDPANFNLEGGYFIDYQGGKRIDQEVMKTIALYNRGVSSLTHGDPTRAVSYFNEVNRRLEGLDHTNLYLAIAYERIGKWDEALKTLKKAIIHELVSSEHFRFLGTILRRFPPDRSIPIFQEYVELARSSSEAHLWFGYFLASAGRFDQAKEEFLTAKRLDPENPEIDIALSRIEHELSGQKPGP